VPKDTYPVQWIGQQALVALPEYIDVSNAGQIREELLAVLNRGAEALIADMTATISCDHAGADAVARAYQRAAASRTQLRLVVTSGSVLQMLGMTGVGRLVPVYPSVEAALTARLPAAYPRSDRSVKLAERDEHVETGPDVGVEIALLDRDGVIAWVNQAWRAFAASNGGDPARIGPGVSYLQVCAAAGDDPAAGEVAAAIRAALAGDLPGQMTVVVPCHSAAAERWFDVLISSRLDNQGRCMGVAVTLSLARSRPRASPVRSGRPGWGLRAARGPGGPGPGGPRPGGPGPGGPAAGSTGVITQGVLWKMIDAIGDGVALTDDGGTLVLANRPLEEMFGYLPGELTGQPVERLIPADLQASHRGHLAAYAHAPKVRPMGAGAPLTGLRKDGSAFPAEISLRPLPTAHGRFALAVVRDLTTTTTSQQAHRSQKLLDLVVTALYQVGLSLKDVGDLPPSLGRPRIDGALDVIDETISRIREATFADRDR
jgi:anti-anti-sigma factor